MKKVLFFLMLSMLFCLASCGITQKDEVKTNIGSSGSGSVSVSKKESDVSDVFNADEILNNLQTTTYTWNDYYSYSVALVVKNNSSFNCRLSANVLFKNAAGELIGAADDSTDTFEAGQEVCLVFSNEVEFSSFDYEYEVSKLEYYDCVSSSLSCETTVTTNKAIIAITNNGEKTAEHVEYNILFMLGDEVVDYNWGYATDDNSEIKPGKTIIEEVKFYNDKKDFDNVKVYYNGKAKKD